MAEFQLEKDKSTQFAAIPENSILEAEILAVTVEESFFWVDKDDHSKGKDMQVSFRFKVIQDDFTWSDGAVDEETGEVLVYNAKNRNLWGNTSTKFSTHPDCKLRVWVQEILGVDELPVDFVFDTDTLVGSTVKIVVGNYEKTNKDGSKTTKDNVDSVIRISGFQDASDIF